MSKAVGSITLSTTGTGKSFTGLGFTPTFISFKVGAIGGSSSTETLSLGAATSSTAQYVITKFDDHTGNYTNNTNASNCIWVRNHNGGGWVDDLLASFNSFVSGGFKLDVTAANSNYSVFFEASN